MLHKSRPTHWAHGALLLAFTMFASADQPSIPGIPVDDQLTIQRCGGCHQRDSNGMMKRLSYMRTTPEVWEQSIKRMMRLNGLTATPDEIRHIVRYLSNNNGLAPEEMKPGFFEVEHRFSGAYQDDHIPDQALEHTCNYCHSIGRVLAQRRTRDDYEKLVAMHIALFPGSETGAFKPPRPRPVAPEEVPARSVANGPGQPTLERVGTGRRNATAADAKYPVDLAVDYLASAQPLITPEWTAWRAAMRPPKLAGTWLLTGYQPGRGKIYGQVVVTPGTADDQFGTNVQFSYISTGTNVTRTGKGIVYTGYSWRGRATSGSPTSDASTTIPSEWREAMMLARDGNSMEGRWFWGAYTEFGIDVRLVRLGAEPVVLGSDLYSLQSPSHHELKIYGANFPVVVIPSDIDLGPGVKVTRVVKSTPTLLMVEVDVAKGLPVGMRDLTVARATAVKALTIFDKVSYIQVTPNANMSRLGGVKWPKQFAQFEAVAYADGPDHQAHTADDVALGPVSASWSLEEFYSTPDDDDIKFVGAVNDSGLFTPNVEGPNPNRRKQANNFPTNNFGDVWVTANYTSPDGTLLRARSYLVVTIPLYAHYDQPEVAQ